LGVNAQDYRVGHTTSFEHHNVSNLVYHMIMWFVWGYFQQSIVWTWQYQWLWTRKHTFIAWKVLWSIDLALNGGKNVTGEVALHIVESLGIFERGCLSSRSSIV